MSTPLITIYVRHTPGCKYDGDEFTKRCDCRKHMRWSLGGKQFRKQADTRSWTEAEESKKRLEAQLNGDTSAPVFPGKQTIRAAKDVFIQSKLVRDITADATQRYRTEIGRFVKFCEDAGVFTLDAITLVILLQYKATWSTVYPSSTTRLIVQKRLNGFLTFCKDAGWITTVPRMDPVKVTEPPTLPISPAEYERLLAVSSGQTRAIIQLMRWSGLAVRDASCLRTEGLQEDGTGAYSVATKRQKTGAHVYVPIPPQVAREILAYANAGEEFIFWTQKISDLYFSRAIGRRISAAFRLADIPTAGHMISHRLRDTFAVDLLGKGIPIGEVSKMLGHESVTTTEKHYAQWAKGRQDRITKLVTATW